MTQVLAPLGGRVLRLQDVPDPVFAGLVVGPGVAIDPSRTRAEVVSPVTGRVVKLHPHAFAVVTEDGDGVLVHLGIDTVRLNGTGFTLHVDEGAQVSVGQRIVTWDPADVEAGGRSPICPVVALEARPDQLSDVLVSGEVAPGSPLFEISQTSDPALGSAGTVEGDEPTARR